jgi:hypothetical protein
VSDETSALTYASMAETATQQAESRKLRNGTINPEGAGAGKAWFRMRRLVRESNMSFLASALGLDLSVLLMISQGTQVGPPIWVYLLPILTMVTAGMAAYGFARAWRLIVAARKKHGVQCRYTLLHSHLSGMPWLVFFEESDNDQAAPSGMLPLRYGPPRDYYRDMPAPFGEATLTGTMRTGAAVVPRIHGFPVWPRGSFIEVDLDNTAQAGRLGELVRPK